MKFSLAIAAATFALATAGIAAEWRVASATEFAAASVKVKAGDTIVWAAGRHADVAMRLRGQGEERHRLPCAETTGGAIFTGASQPKCAVRG
jgi:hypothetical protein